MKKWPGRTIRWCYLLNIKCLRLTVWEKKIFKDWQIAENFEYSNHIVHINVKYKWKTWYYGQNVTIIRAALGPLEISNSGKNETSWTYRLCGLEPSVPNCRNTVRVLDKGAVFKYLCGYKGVNTKPDKSHGRRPPPQENGPDGPGFRRKFAGLDVWTVNSGYPVYLRTIRNL